MKQWRQIIGSAALAIGFLLLFAGVMIATFFLTQWLYQSIGHAPPPFLAQLVNSLLGLVLYALLASAVARWAGRGQPPGRRQMGAMEPNFAALEQIAKGDFQVRLPSSFRANLFAHELAKSVNHMALELNQMEQVRQEFIADVSHEIQSPLTSIRGFAQVLHDEQLSASDRLHYLTIIEAESLRLSRMTDNMLKLAALEVEDVQGQRRVYRLDRQIRALILACEPQWLTKCIDVEVDLEELEILGNEDLLGQVWSNLLHNSIKFTLPQGHIVVEAQRQGDVIECRVADTGVGIDPEAQSHVFERFYKADQSRSNSGSGLGLAIARRIVELHHGQIGIHSEPGMGTAVTVTLPVPSALHPHGQAFVACYPADGS